MKKKIFFFYLSILISTKLTIEYTCSILKEDHFHNYLQKNHNPRNGSVNSLTSTSDNSSWSPLNYSLFENLWVL